MTTFLKKLYELIKGLSISRLVWPTTGIQTERPTPIAICNGVLCIADEYGMEIMLWNPIIQKLLILPQPIYNCEFINLLHNLCLDFGFESLRNDYKVFKIFNQDGYRVEIFSLANNSWKDISDITPFYHWWIDILQILYGALYCLVHQHRHKYCAILEFDLNAEVFEEIELPELLFERRNKKSES
ncbi:putative F-box protein At3g10240 [Rutidosis leptorrhynchoides]|uniref:putative F-box protein At3g10240 n=1 Tax=Rutidosis leptorrhynchoides TaxID=125765 RepID=UPI003A995B03